MSSVSNNSNSSTFGNAKKAGMGKFKAFLCLPDRIDAKKHPMRAKCAYIAMDVSIIGVSVLILFLPEIVTGVGNKFAHMVANPFEQFANPKPQTLMGMVPFVLIGGWGISWLVGDLIDEGAAHEVAKVKEVASFLLMMCAGGVFMGLGMQGCAVQNATNQYTWIGLLMCGTSFWFLDSKSGS